MTLRMLLASTALAGMLAGGAFAQDAAAPAANAPAATTSAEPMQSAAAGDYVQRQEADQYLASNLTGTDIYETSAPDARTVGEIRNFVVDKSGKVAAVVIATSGLDDDKTIAAPADKLEWMDGQDGAARAVLKAPVAELQGAPEFTGQSPREAAANGAMMPGSGAASTSAGGAMAPGADTGMAPANGAMAPSGNAMAPGGAMTGDTAGMSGTGAMMPVPGATPSSGTPSDSVAATSTTQAAGASNTADMAAGTAAPAAGAAAPAAATPMPAANGYLAALADGQELSGEIIGSSVYSGPGDDAETIGSVNDLVMTRTGDVPAAVIGVGGFLGIGEKNVGVPFARLQMAQSGNDAEGRLVLAATKDQLQAAPAFEEREERSAAATPAAGGMGTDNAMGAGGAMATGTGVAPVAGSNMAANDPMQQQGTVAPGSTVADGNAMAGGAMASGAAAGGAMANADPSTTTSTSADQRSTMQPVTGPDLTADNLNGVTVYGPNDQSIGSVGDIALSADGRVDAIVVDVGGFLGIGSKPVAVAMDNLQFLRDANGRVNVYTQFTADQLKNAPAFDRETYAQNRESMRLTQSGAAQPAK